MDPALRDVLLLGLRVLWTIGGPILGAIVLASLLTTVVERFLGVRDPTLGMVSRLGALIASGMFMWGQFATLLQELGKQAFR